MHRHELELTLHTYGGPLYRLQMREESPDRKEHRTVESTAGCEFGENITENNRRKARVKTWGKSLRVFMATWIRYAPAACKVKYTGNQGLLVQCRGVDCVR